MAETEGVIKYQLHHTHKALPNDVTLTELNAWRTVMYQLNLIGQDCCRYDGYGFGNISQRLKTANLQFIISGTQTGQLRILSRQDYCLITEAAPEINQIVSSGESKPSSEALTHASIYLQLKLAHTTANIAYGTPEMANAVAQLFNTQHWQQTAVFTMLGHEDGVVAFGNSLNQAACALITQLSLALAIEQGSFCP